MKRAKMNDSQRTTLMLDLLASDCLHEGNGVKDGTKMMAARKVFLTEVADGTGFAPGYADGFKVALWGSDGFEADGYEVKASKSDLNRELADLSKWQRVGRHCIRWWLVVWDAAWLDDPRIPAEWGLLARALDTDETDMLKVVRHPTARESQPEWPRSFVAAVVRRAAEASPSAAHLVALFDRGLKRGHSEGRAKEREQVRKVIAPLLEYYCKEDGNRWSSEVPLEWVVRQALAHVEQPPLPLAERAS